MKPLNPGEPRQVGRYRLVASLGEGGMGRVLLGVSQDGRLVALKQVHPGFAHDEGFRSRFRREVQTSRMVSGAYTAAVMDADADAATPWLASVFVAGPSLKEAVDATGPLPLDSLRFLAVGLASALMEIHRAGLIHRDLKPSNVILTDDGPRVIDFGIARAAEGETDITHTGSIIGSPGFMSPEQANGYPITPASDVFSLGALLVMAATGRSPFAGASTPQTLYNVVHSHPDLRMVHPDVRRLAEPCLAKDPAVRPTPAQILDFLGPVTPSATPWPPAVHASIAGQKAEVNTALSLPADMPRPRKRRAPLLIAGAATAVVAIAVATGLIVANRDDGTAKAQPAQESAGQPPAPAPFSPEQIGRVDPCKLLKSNSLPNSGPVKEPEAGVRLYHCTHSIGETADKSKSSRIEIDLAVKLSLYEEGERVKLSGTEVIKHLDGKSCKVVAANASMPGFGIATTAARNSGDSCETPLEALGVILDQIRSGSAPLRQASPDSASTVDFCTTMPVTDVTSIAREPVEIFGDNFQACGWIGKKNSFYLKLNRGVGEDYRASGQKPIEIAGKPAYEASRNGPKVMDDCTITWTHRKIDEFTTEELEARVVPQEEVADPGPMCRTAEEFAELVAAKLPKP
ncbi:serine/threonine-protein kinase [Amycolatopsis oliviviridis]|nr:serine/threonine-protein kinase [Amycolatopsis oliviviridis]